jgi:hypothetical protein
VKATWKGPYLSTGQDLSSTNSNYVAAAYGLTYANTFAPADSCAPKNYLPIAVRKINGLDVTNASFSESNDTFKQLYDALYNVTTAAPATSSVGPLQYNALGASTTNVYICMIAAKVN